MSKLEGLDTLLQALKESEEYIGYHNELEKIKNDGQLYQRVCEYRKRCMVLHLGSANNSFEEVTAIRNEYDDMLKNKLAVNFLVAEQKLLKLVKAINGELLNTAALEVDFLEW